MTVAALAVLTLAALCAAGWLWSRDVAARRRADTRTLRAEHRAAAAEARADLCADHARQWAALAEEGAAELIEHRHRCLGELIHTDSGVLP